MQNLLFCAGMTEQSLENGNVVATGINAADAEKVTWGRKNYFSPASSITNFHSSSFTV